MLTNGLSDSKQRSGAEKTPNKKLISKEPSNNQLAVSIKNIINFKNKDYNDSPDVSKILTLL